MKPSTYAGTGRKKRAATLPGHGITAVEKMHRLTLIKRVNAIISDELDSDRKGSQGQMTVQAQLYLRGMSSYAMNSQRAGAPEVRRLIERFDTETLEALSRMPAKADSFIKFHGIISAVVLRGTGWSRKFGDDVEKVLLDIISYRDAISLSDWRDEPLIVHTFSETYRISGCTPGTLPRVGEDGRRSIEALLLVIKREGVLKITNLKPHLYSDDWFIVPPHRTYEEFPVDHGKYLMDQPEMAETYAEYVSSLKLSATAVEWDDFMHFVNTTSSLRDGVL